MPPRAVVFLVVCGIAFIAVFNYTSASSAAQVAAGALYRGLTGRQPGAPPAPADAPPAAAYSPQAPATSAARATVLPPAVAPLPASSRVARAPAANASASLPARPPPRAAGPAPAATPAPPVDAPADMVCAGDLARLETQGCLIKDLYFDRDSRTFLFFGSSIRDRRAGAEASGSPGAAATGASAQSLPKRFADATCAPASVRAACRKVQHGAGSCACDRALSACASASLHAAAQQRLCEAAQCARVRALAACDRP
jgi:hypothetical protein